MEQEPKKRRYRGALAVMGLLICALALLILGWFFEQQLLKDQQQEEDRLGQADQVLEALKEASEKQTEEDASATGPQESIPSADQGDPETERDDLTLMEESTESEKTDSHQRIIFVGDSRTVGMGHAEAEQGDFCIYIGESGEGYQWFVEEGISQMSDAIRDYPDSPVVINFGVNDTESVRDYIELYETFPEIWPETDFYFLSVNPVTSESENVKNGMILRFNNRMRQDGPFPFLDSFTWLILNRFESVDGVHYSEKTYRDIHDFAQRSVALRQRTH